MLKVNETKSLKHFKLKTKIRELKKNFIQTQKS